MGKVVAGLEADNTNIFLQSLYEAATTKPDSSTAVSMVLAEMTAAAPPQMPPAANGCGCHGQAGVAGALQVFKT